MEDRLKKFKHGRMNVDELNSFKTEIEAMDDMELSDFLDTGDVDIEFTQSDIIEIQEKLNGQIHDERRRLFIHRFIAACAAVMIPAVIICSIIIYDKNQKLGQYDELLAKAIVVETDNGESKLTALPDGSTVYMGPASLLRYSLASFCSDERIVEYSGEGDFCISKIENSSFVLKSSDFKIRVLGTEFSVYSRTEKENIEVYLDKGSIELTSLISNNNLIMNPGETATISRATGAIQIYDSTDSYKTTAGHATIFFTSDSLCDVAKEIERYYGYKIVFDESLKSISFTGSLPTDNLNQVIFILENTLNISLSKNDDGMILSIE